MTQYIDKATVVTKIKDWISDARRRYTMSKVQFSLSDRVESLENLLCFIDTLEVKEEVKDADLERGIEKELDTRWYGEECLDIHKFKESAKYFYELGLKAQKKGK